MTGLIGIISILNEGLVLVGVLAVAVMTVYFHVASPQRIVSSYPVLPDLFPCSLKRHAMQLHVVINMRIKSRVMNR